MSICLMSKQLISMHRLKLFVSGKVMKACTNFHMSLVQILCLFPSTRKKSSPGKVKRLCTYFCVSLTQTSVFTHPFKQVFMARMCTYHCTSSFTQTASPGKVMRATYFCMSLAQLAGLRPPLPPKQATLVHTNGRSF